MESDSFTIPLDITTGKSMSLYLYKNVENTPEIRKKLMSGQLSCCVIKASLVVDPLHVAVAANKAALRDLRSKLTTRNIFTEILFAMSTSSKITDSLVKFGIHDKDKNLVIVTIHDTDKKKDHEDAFLAHINGTRLSISEIRNFTESQSVKKIYKIEDDELAISSLLDSVISRISCDSSV